MVHTAAGEVEMRGEPHIAHGAEEVLWMDAPVAESQLQKTLLIVEVDN